MRAALFLIRAATPSSEREWIVGDTVEEYERRERLDGVPAARGWLWREAWRVMRNAPRHRWAVRRGTARRRQHPAMRIREGTIRSITSDARHAVRRWAARPALALTAMLTLSLGIGATTAIYSIVDGVLLRPAPWHEPERLVSVYRMNPAWRNDPVFTNWDHLRLSWPDFRDLQRATPAFGSIGSWSPQPAVIGGETPDRVSSVRMSSGLLPLLGVRPVLGRVFSQDEDSRATDSVMISYEAWQRRFGGQAGIIGHHVVLDDTPRTIIGVLPRGFRVSLQADLANDAAPAEFVVPFGTLGTVDRSPTNLRYNVVARLATGASLAEADAQAGRVLKGSDTRTERLSQVVPLVEDQLGQSREPLFIILGASSLLLLIACANVAGLLMKDVSARRHEIAVRRALGADRWRVARQLLVENLMLAAGGGAAGLVAAWWLTPALIAIAPRTIPRIDSVSVDLRVIAFAALVTLITTTVFGTWPSLAGSSAFPVEALHESRNAGSARRHMQRLLVVAQIALAVVLLVGATLLAETVIHLSGQPVGFDPRGVLVLGVRLPPDATPNSTARAQLETSLLDRLRATPGVESAAGIAAPPFGGVTGFNTIAVDGRPNERLSAQRHVVTDHYFRTMAMPILRGRGFEAADAAWQQIEQPPAGTLIDGAGVVIVSQELERRFFGGNAVGRRLTFGWTRLTVVGVVPDVKMMAYSEDATPAFYLFAQQMPWLAVSQFVIRTREDTVSMSPRLREAAAAVSGRRAVSSIAALNDRMTSTIANERYRAALSSTFGVLALVLTVVGLFGLLSRTVHERRREIGVRIAVGARPADVLKIVVAEGGGLVLAGLVVGVPAAVVAARVIRSLLFGVQPFDPYSFALASVVLAGATLAAMILPAVRASRVDPVVTLRAG